MGRFWLVLGPAKRLSRHVSALLLTVACTLPPKRSYVAPQSLCMRQKWPYTLKVTRSSEPLVADR